MSATIPPDWMIDVLADIRDHASRSDMTRLARELDDVMIVAAMELARKGLALSVANNNVEPTGSVHRPTGRDREHR